ncbi:TetR/AcrR family transcriptional regulator [bacterium]|nr:TetR/AcrR family transcriptional regulator [bacterium]
MPRNSEISRRKIMKVAEKIFAQKGFDGARVDEIAKTAGVNKALIYYYFKSKSMILDEIFKDFVNEATELIYKYFDEDIELNEPEFMNQVFDIYMEYLESRKDTLKIMLTESLKSGDEAPPLFSFVEASLNHEADSIIKSMKQKGYNIADQKDQIKVTEFFTSFMPVISYIVFRDKWCRFFGVSKEQLKNMFFEAYKATHISHHITQHP